MDDDGGDGDVEIMNQASEYIHIIVKKKHLKIADFLSLLDYANQTAVLLLTYKFKKKKSTCLYNTVEWVFFGRG